MKECFGWDEKKGCTVLSNEGQRELCYRFCGTMGCPFFKEDRHDIRLHDKIIRKEKENG